MATHHILKDGTSYAVSGGSDLVNGTKYQIWGGRTLIDGTVYEIGFAKPVSLNWLLNEKITLPASTLYGRFQFPGDSEGYIYTKMEQRYLSGVYHLVYATSSAGVYVYAGGFVDKWQNTKARTINFLEEPTGDMLAWLEQNGVPQ